MRGPPGPAPFAYTTPFRPDELAAAIATAEELRAGAEAAPAAVAAAEEALATLRDQLTHAVAEREAVHTEFEALRSPGDVESTARAAAERTLATIRDELTAP